MSDQQLSYRLLWHDRSGPFFNATPPLPAEVVARVTNVSPSIPMYWRLRHRDHLRSRKDSHCPLALWERLSVSLIASPFRAPPARTKTSLAESRERAVGAIEKNGPRINHGSAAGRQRRWPPLTGRTFDKWLNLESALNVRRNSQPGHCSLFNWWYWNVPRWFIDFLGSLAYVATWCTSLMDLGRSSGK